MSYVLENQEEATRLEAQAKMSNYDLGTEFADLRIQPWSKVLDAGCGSGLLSRHLVDRFKGIKVTGCDASAPRLQQARELAGDSRYREIEFRQGDLQALGLESASYDWVICRFVLEHLAKPEAAVSEFFRVLKPGGKACLVDLDGIIYNIHTNNAEFNGLLKEFQRKWDTDFYVGRKLPAMLKAAGFGSIQWKMLSMQFHGKDLVDETELTRQRLEFSIPKLSGVFGDEKTARRFVALYLQEMRKPEVTLFYNKFVAYGEKL